MQYTKNTWAPRIGEGLNKFKDERTGNILKLTPVPDSVIEEGTPFTADWMNNLENGLEKAAAAANTWIASVSAVDADAFQYDLTITNYVEAIGNVIVFQAPADAGESFLFTINGKHPGGDAGKWYQVAFSDLSVDVTGAWVGTALLSVIISGVASETGNTLAFVAAGSGGGSSKIKFTYTGSHQIFGDETKGYAEFYTSGILSFDNDVQVDVFLVGGGAGTFAALNQAWSSPGGGGGYTATFYSIHFSKGEEIAVTIGAGGQDADGGSTSVGSYTAEGGKRGIQYSLSFKGGNGGCGGGSGSASTGKNGGSNGSNGDSYSSDYTGGIGQGSTTCEFANTQLRLFSGGGASGGGFGGSIVSAGGKGGEGGGGDGGAGNAIGAPGQPNTGGGAGGNGGNYKNATAAGGSGIAIIRWGDWTTNEEASA